MFDSVDNVIAQFTKAAARLNALVDKHSEKSGYHAVLADQHRIEMERATRIQAKLKDLVS